MIVKAEYIKDYQLKVFFDDGVIKEIDLYPFMSKSKHPLIRKFLDIYLFRKFRIEYGALAWGDNEFDINPMSIHKGEFDINPKKVKIINKRKRELA